MEDVNEFIKFKYKIKALLEILKASGKLLPLFQQLIFWCLQTFGSVLSPSIAMVKSMMLLFKNHVVNKWEKKTRYLTSFSYFFAQNTKKNFAFPLFSFFPGSNYFNSVFNILFIFTQI